jgi:hypothetical protein
MVELSFKIATKLISSNQIIDFKKIIELSSIFNSVNFHHLKFLIIQIEYSNRQKLYIDLFCS